MLELKKRLAIIALGIITLWPGLHFGLYQGFGIDPWKLFGWAMYTKPQEVQQLGVFELRDGPAARPGGRLREVPLDAGPVAAAVARHLAQLVEQCRVVRVRLAQDPEIEKWNPIRSYKRHFCFFIQ